MVTTNRDPIVSKRLAIYALLPYAILVEQLGQQEMANAIMHVVQASNRHYFMSSVPPYFALFAKPSSPFRNWLVVLASPYRNWEDITNREITVVEWAAAALTVSDTEEVIRSVVDTLLQIVKIDSLRPHIPIQTWAWVKKRQSLPLVDWGRRWETTPDAVRYVRGLGDQEIIKAYFLLIWSEWNHLCADVLSEMVISIERDFGGIGVWGHRNDLINRLDYVLEKLKLEFVWVNSIEGTQRYTKLKGAVLDIDREAMNTITREPLTLVPLKCTDFRGRKQILTPPSHVLCLFTLCDNLVQFLLPPAPS